MMGTMKAIRVHQFGGPEQLTLDDVADLQPGPAQVVVRVRAAGVNPAETYIRAGTYASLPSLPYTPGSDAAGTIDAVGAGVTHLERGDRVWVFAQRTAIAPSGPSGSYAEQMLCEAALVHPLPDRLTFAQGAAIGVPYLTAWRALMLQADMRPGESVLVHGASGGVGIATIQIARAAGQIVIGTAGSPRGLAVVREQGAHHVFDHTTKTYRDEILKATGGTGVNAIVEMAAHLNLADDFTLLAPRGRVVIVGSRGPLEINPRAIMGKQATVRGGTLWALDPDHLRMGVAALNASFENGALTPVVAQELPLAEAARAHERVMAGGAHGKIVLVP
jgi:NADPH:quinone reductase